MGQTLEIGSRIELVPMDPHFNDISIGLYRQEGPAYRVHTYSPIEGATERIDFVTGAMLLLGDMARTSEGLLHFSCGAAHELAVKRLFLEACKLPPTGEVAPRPMQVFDKKSNGNISATSQGEGVYHLAGDGDDKRLSRRIEAVAGGLVKLAELNYVDDTSDRIAFPCGTVHDPLIGLLMGRALNVRAVLREQEQTASRGVLAAPSNQ